MNLQTSHNLFVHWENEPRSLNNTIYNLKYLSLMLTMAIIVCTQRFRMENNTSILSQALISYLQFSIVFVISCYSQFIGINIIITSGHRKLFLISYLSQLIYYSSLIFPQIQNDIIIVLLPFLRFMLYIQVKIQIYGTWQQNQFARIFVEFYLISLIIVILSFILDRDKILIFIIILVLGINLILIAKTITNFKSPETDSVHKDFIRLITDAKPFIFTLLFGLSQLLLQILINYIEKIYFKDTMVQQISSLLPIFIIFIFIRSNKQFDYQPTFLIAISLALLILLSLIMVVLLKFDHTDTLYTLIYAVLYFFALSVYSLGVVFMIPQYQQILLNIGVRNIDFTASYPTLAIGIIQISNFYYFKNSSIIQDHFSYSILALAAIIIILSFLFYQKLGFKHYFRRSNRSYVEENEFYIQIV